VIVAALTFALLQAVSASTDALTELELTLRENVRLQKELARAYEQADACRMELAPVIKAKNDAAVAKAEAALKARIEANHPGHVFSIEAGTLEKRPAGTVP
jgi:hypothetical protein